MTDDIVERLRVELSEMQAEWRDAAGKLEPLQTEIERLRKVEEYHDQAIERAERLEAECERLRKLRPDDDWEERGAASAMQVEIERLREALQNLMNDVLEYERINNFAPNPGKQDCWQSVTEARRALEPKP